MGEFDKILLASWLWVEMSFFYHLVERKTVTHPSRKLISPFTMQG